MLDLIITFIIILILTLWLQSDPLHWKGKGIPYKIPWPVLGNAQKAFSTPMHQLWNDLYQKHKGSLVGIHLFMKPSVLVTDPKIVKQMLLDDSHLFLSRDLHVEDYDLLYGNILYAEGEEWRAVRSKLTPYFTPAKLKFMTSLIQVTIDEMVNSIRKERVNGIINVCDLTKKMSTDVIMSTIFGLEGDSFKNKNSFFFSLQKEFVNATVALKMLLSMMSPKIYRTLRITLLSNSTNEKLTNFIKDVVNMRLSGTGVREDFVQGMAELHKKEQSISQEKKYYSDGTAVPRFDIKGITSQCVLMYAAGTETTGTTTYFLLYELAMNPEVQEKMRSEIKEVMDKHGSAFSYEHFSELTYTDMVIKETLRKYPVIFHNARKCVSDCEIGGIKIRKGTSLIIPVIDFHHDPLYFPHPDKFIPERFSKESTILPGTYLPFGMGPRICLGMKMSLTVITLALCNLLTKFKFKPCEKTEKKITYGFTTMLSAVKGVWLNVEEI